MEEDIKILEEFKANGYYMLYIKYGDRITTNLKLERALGNLIKAYKELEENSIPKSVIREKIENNKKVIDDTNDGDLIHRLLNEIDILQEILEG